MVAAEQCFLNLIDKARIAIENSFIEAEQFELYQLLLDLIESYHINILSQKVYWDTQSERDMHKKLWDDYKETQKLERIDFDEFKRKREILFVNYDLKEMKKSKKKYDILRAYYIERMKQLHALRELKNHSKGWTGKWITRRRAVADWCNIRSVVWRSFSMIEVNYIEIEELPNEEKLIKYVIKNVLIAEEVKHDVDVYVTLTNNSEIHEINKKFREVDRPTDVLSFPMYERDEIKSLKEPKRGDEEEILGDIIISVEKVKEQSIEYGHSFERELAYLVTHGMLHLLGYDHMIEEEKSIMREREEAILAKMGIIRD